MFGGTGKCTLTYQQRMNLMRKMMRVKSATDGLMYKYDKRNRLAVDASDAEYEKYDFIEAHRLYKLAIAKDNHELATCNLALWYLQGRPGVPADPPKAVELFEQAAKQGVGMALANLAEFALLGAHGMKKDLDRAYKLARDAIDDDRHTNDSLAISFWVLFRVHHGGRPGAPAANKRAALRCLEYLALIEGPEGERKMMRRGGEATSEMLKMYRFLVIPETTQAETDRRYDRMAYELDQLPRDQQPGTYGEYEEALRRYGFQLVEEQRLAKKRNKKCNWAQFVQASGSWRLVPGFKYEQEQGQEQAGGAAAAGAEEADELSPNTPKHTTRAAATGTAASAAAGSGGSQAGAKSGDGGGGRTAAPSTSSGAGKNSNNSSSNAGSGEDAGMGCSSGSSAVGTGTAGSSSSSAEDSSTKVCSGGESSGKGGKGGKGSSSRGPGFMCGHCSKMGAKKVCSRCGQHYCSAACQRKDWNAGHKRICDLVAEQRPV